MKKYIVFFFVSLHVINANSQNVSIQLSIEWQKEDYLFNDSTFQCIPYLKVAYQNNMNFPIYFLKPTKSHSGFPVIMKGSFTAISGNSNSFEKKNLNCNYSKNDYKVIMYANPYYDMGWVVFPDTVDIMKDHTIDIINDHLSAIYNLLDCDSIRHRSCSIDFEYKSTDITEENILTKHMDKFCFINAGETVTESYNLIGFDVVKGGFNFQFNTDSLYEYVYSDSFLNEKQKKWCFKKTYLPPKVKAYELYYGKFKSNSISIKFN